jgi:hypothetical protein
LRVVSRNGASGELQGFHFYELRVKQSLKFVTYQSAIYD